MGNGMLQLCVVRELARSDFSDEMAYLKNIIK